MKAALDAAPEFLAGLLDALEELGLDVSAFAVDHLCYRVATTAKYAKARQELLALGELLHEAQISGRPIATFRLRHAIRYRERAVPLVELPSPKAGSPYPTGWEHAEFVVPQGLAWLQARYPKYAWDTSAMTKPHNPELRLAFENMSAKFHPEALDVVIARELGCGM